MEKEKRKEKMVEKKQKQAGEEGKADKADFRGCFVLQKLSTRLQCAFLPPPALLGCALKGAGKQSHRNCWRFTWTQNRGALRERKLLSDPCTTNHDGDGAGPETGERAGRKPAESSLFLQRSHWQHWQVRLHRDTAAHQIHVHSRSLSLHSWKEEPKGFEQRVKFFKVSVAICSLNPVPEAQELSHITVT